MEMYRMLFFFSVCVMLAVCGCNSYNVSALPYDSRLTSVVLVENPRVIVHDFTDVLQDEFNARNIKVVRKPENYVQTRDEYVIRYDARQSWDFSNYLSYAMIRVEKDGMTMATGMYRHIGRSCSLDIFTKWRGTQWKMSDLYGELLKNYQKGRE